ncbi:autotransporter outer membrane beta-barrel domain-containing protein [Agaricicola taiwanensis]|nr:autotransporter outer membrane beta-barrel domain-containing protein [Agaricicola taiwanensis]
MGGELASAATDGCEAVGYGDFNLTYTSSGQRTVHHFYPGETVNFVVTITDGGGGATWELHNMSGMIAQRSGSGSYNVSHTVGGSAEDLIIDVVIIGTGTISVTATCGAAIDSSDLTDSKKVEAVQVMGTRMSARASAAVQTTSVSNAITDAFSAAPQPISMNSGGLRLNYAPETAPGLEWAAAQRLWSLWADFRYTSWDAGGNGVLDGDQINALVGLGYRIDDRTLVGVFGGYETFDIEMSRFSATLEGDGGTLGVYAARYMLPNLRWDVIGSWSGISYDTEAGAAAGSFDGSRWQLSTGLTGNHQVSAFILEPSARLQGLWETQDAWVDSLGALQAKQNFSAARFALGGRAIMPWEMDSGIKLSPYLGLYGDYNFGDEGATPAGSNIGIDNGLSARVTAGASLSRGAGSLFLGGELGGLGGDERYWSASARGIWEF